MNKCSGRRFKFLSAIKHFDFNRWILIAIVLIKLIAMEDNGGTKVTGIRQIVRLKELLQKWQSVTLSPRSNNNNNDNNNNKQDRKSVV